MLCSIHAEEEEEDEDAAHTNNMRYLYMWTSLGIVDCVKTEASFMHFFFLSLIFQFGLVGAKHMTLRTVMWDSLEVDFIACWTFNTKGERLKKTKKKQLQTQEAQKLQWNLLHNTLEEI